MMGKVFPVIFAFISYRLPTGVVLYFLVSNLWQIGQQALIFRTPPEPIVGGADGGAIAATGSAPKPAGKGGDGKRKAAAPEPQPEGLFKRALSQAREAKTGQSGGNGDGQSKPAPKQPPAAAGGRPSDGTIGRAQPSGSQPRPKKRRR
jgi:YidC/Oxa1 family membrane protein insertase